MKRINAIITGATGMVGKGVLWYEKVIAHHFSTNKEIIILNYQKLN